MQFTFREVNYFEKPGEHNTDLVVDAVTKYIEHNRIRDVVIASSTGSTALKLATAIGNEARIVCVSDGPYRREMGFEWPIMDAKTKDQLESMGVIVLENAPYALHGEIYEDSETRSISPDKVFRDTLFTFGQGMKVAVEAVIMAVDCGRLEPFKEVIGVGGTGSGADTAIVLRSTHRGTVFSQDKDKRLEIYEILAMPRLKKMQG